MHCNLSKWIMWQMSCNIEDKKKILRQLVWGWNGIYFYITVNCSMKWSGVCFEIIFDIYLHFFFLASCSRYVYGMFFCHTNVMCVFFSIQNVFVFPQLYLWSIHTLTNAFVAKQIFYCQYWFSVEYLKMLGNRLISLWWLNLYLFLDVLWFMFLSSLFFVFLATKHNWN